MPRSALLATLAACHPVVPAEGPRTWDGDFLFDSLVISCDELSWTYDVRMMGWGDEVTVDIVGRQFSAIVLREHHSIPEVDYGEDWAHHLLTLEQAYGGEDYVPSEVTAIDCSAKTLVTYGFAAWRYDGDMQECIAWGVDPAGEFPDCVNWGDDGHDQL